jgi:N-acetylornithine carbamoyltransferase
MKRFIDLAEHTPEAVAELLELAGRLDRHPEPQALAGKVLGMLFFNPSLRTVASFQAAMGRLGGSSFVITPGTGTWKLETRNGIVMDGEAAEHIREAVPVLASYADVLGIRAFAGGIDLEADLEERKFMEMTDICPVPLMNLESEVNHPVPGAGRLEDHGRSRRARERRSLRAVMGQSPVARCRWRYPRPRCTWPQCAAWTSRCCGPTVTRCRSRSCSARAMRQPLSGGSVRESDERDEAMQGAHVIYAKSWASTRYYGRPADDRALRKNLEHWMVSEALVRECRGGSDLHALPAGPAQCRGRGRSAGRAAQPGAAAGPQPDDGADGDPASPAGGTLRNEPMLQHARGARHRRHGPEGRGARTSGCSSARSSSSRSAGRCSAMRTAPAR